VLKEPTSIFHGPHDHAEPRHARMAQQVVTGTTVAGDGAAFAGVDLSALAVDVGLCDVPPIREPGRVLQARAEHRRHEGHASDSRNSPGGAFASSQGELKVWACYLAGQNSGTKRQTPTI